MHDSDPIPPPSPELMAAIEQAEPVTLRVPLRDFGRVVAASLALMGLHLVASRTRPDLPWLPVGWVVLVALTTLLAYLVALAAVLVPPSGQVQPSPVRAQRAAIAAAALLLGLSAFAENAPGHTVMIPPALWPQTRAILHCVVAALEMSALPTLLGILVLRRAVPLRTVWLGAGLGGANGALAALVLHLHCNGGGFAHLAIGHAGNVVVGAALGAVVVPRFLTPRA